MLQELILILTQFGGGPGDPSNNVVRFLLAAFFWVVLFIVSFRLWRTTRDRHHLYFSIASSVGVSREIFMFTAEYGSFRGYLSFPAIFRYYPPLEHAVAILSIILMGYAFLRFYFGFERFSRFFLIYSSILTTVTYVIIAPLWINFLDLARHNFLNDSLFMGAQFHDFPGDLVFRLLGALVVLCVLGAFLHAKSKSIPFPWLAFIAFSCFFFDDALQALNDLCNDRYAPLFAPVRHCLHIIAIMFLVGGYWWEVTRQLKRREKFLDTLLDAIPDQIFYKNSLGVYLGCNKNFADNFIGLRKDQIIGSLNKDIIRDPELAAIFQKSDKESIDTDSTQTYETQYTRSDGKQVNLETIKTPFHDDEGHVAGLIGVSRDVSERKNLEAQLFHAQKMEAVGQFAGGAAHDFNNILTVINGYLFIMRTEMGSDHPQSFCIDMISQSAERATKLIQNLMTFSRKKSLDACSCNLNTLVQDFHEFLTRLIPEDIQLSMTCCDEKLNVFVDRNQIEQVLSNLVANARDAMPKGGSIRIMTEFHELNDGFIQSHGYGQRGNYALISVSDTGTGMSEADRQRVFDPFFTTKEIGKGTGLGLAITYGIVKQHNGYINVSSKPGNGATFMIYLPICVHESETDKSSSVNVIHDRGTETVLVVEDEAAVRLMVESILKKHDYNVILAEDGQEAVEKFAANQDKIRLVIMDIIMPKMNGKEASDEIRRLQPNTSILFTSGYTADIIQSRGELGQGEDFISKPVNPEKLLTKVREMLDMY